MGMLTPRAGFMQLKPTDYLVNTDGRASCTFNLGNRIYIQPPRHNKGSLTTAQKETIFKLFQINKYPMNVYFQSCE